MIEAKLAESRETIFPPEQTKFETGRSEFEEKRREKLRGVETLSFYLWTVIDSKICYNIIHNEIARCVLFSYFIFYCVEERFKISGLGRIDSATFCNSSFCYLDFFYRRAPYLVRRSLFLFIDRFVVDKK